MDEITASLSSTVATRSGVDHRLGTTDVQRVEQGLRNLRANDAYAHIADTFRALADPSRVKIMDALLAQELCTSDLAAIVGISDPAVSQHLRLLRAMRVVRAHRHGNRVFYSLDDEHVRRLLILTAAHLEHSSEDVSAPEPPGVSAPGPPGV